MLYSPRFCLTDLFGLFLNCKVHWLFNNRPVDIADYEISSRDNAHSLHISEVFAEDAGNYSVVTENDFGKAVHSARLIVVGQPAFVSTGVDTTVEKLAQPPSPPSRESSLLVKPDDRWKTPASSAAAAAGSQPGELEEARHNAEEELREGDGE